MGRVKRAFVAVIIVIVTLIVAAPAQARQFRITPLLIESEAINWLLGTSSSTDVKLGVSYSVFLRSKNNAWRMRVAPDTDLVIPGYDPEVLPMFEEVEYRFSVKTTDGLEVLDANPRISIGLPDLSKLDRKEQERLRKIIGSIKTNPAPHVLMVDEKRCGELRIEDGNKLVIGLANLEPGTEYEGAFRIFSESRTDNRFILLNHAGHFRTPNVVHFSFTLADDAQVMRGWRGISPARWSDRLWVQQWKAAMSILLESRYANLRPVRYPEGMSLAPSGVEADELAWVLEDKAKADAKKKARPSPKPTTTRPSTTHAEHADGGGPPASPQVLRPTEAGGEVKCTVLIYNWRVEYERTTQFVVEMRDGSTRHFPLTHMEIVQRETVQVAKTTISLPPGEYRCWRSDYDPGKGGKTAKLRVAADAVNEYDF